jgi:hypothetical protein
VHGSWDSSVSTVTSYGLVERGFVFKSRQGAKDFSLLPGVQTGPGAYTGSYPMSTEGSIPGSNAAGA